jgi:topoisomerase IA-like protein
VAANPKMSDLTNARATSFITERLGSIKAAATKRTVTKAVATKMTTVSCVKGKQTKKVTAVKPVCPTGYKKK